MKREMSMEDRERVPRIVRVFMCRFIHARPATAAASMETGATQTDVVRNVENSVERAMTN